MVSLSLIIFNKVLSCIVRRESKNIMAIIIKTIAEFTDPNGGVCVFQYDYDDIDLRVRAVRCVNECHNPAYGWVARSSNTRVFYDATFPANSTVEVSISTGAANRLQLSVTESGKLDGLEVSFRYPAIL